MKLSGLRPLVDDARSHAREGCGLDGRDHLDIAGAAHAPGTPHPELPVKYQESLGLDRDLNYFPCHVRPSSHALRFAKALKNIFIGSRASGYNVRHLHSVRRKIPGTRPAWRARPPSTRKVTAKRP